MPGNGGHHAGDGQGCHSQGPAVENFRVQITVHNLFEDTSNTVTIEDDFIFDALDIFFDIGNDTDLTSLLGDFGVSVADFDSSILNTE